MTASPSQLYNSAIAALSDPAGTDWSSDTIKVALVTSSYTFSASHDFFNDITNELSGTGYTAGGMVLNTKTEVATGATRTYDAADPTWPALAAAAGTPAAAIVYEDTGTASTSPLLAYLRLPGTAPDGTNYTVVLPSDGLIVVSANTALQWVDVGPLLASHANSADYDPNAQHSALSVSGNSITVTSLDTVSGDGTSEGTVYVVGDPAVVVPGWVSDGSCWLLVAITVVTSATNNSQMRIACGLAANTSTYPGAAYGVRRTTVDVQELLGPTSDGTLTASTAHRTGVVALTGDGSQVSVVYGVSDTSNTRFTSDSTITSGQLRLCLFSGCESAAGTGPHTMVLRIRVAALPMVPA